MITEVSSTPRWCLDTRGWILVYVCIDVGPETFGIDRGQVRERFD
jgi:hypothetical protein